MSLTPILSIQKIENTHPMGFHPLSNSRHSEEETPHSYWGNLRIASRSHRQIGQLSCNPLMKFQYRISCVAICHTHHIGYLLAVVGQAPYIVCNNLGSTYYCYYKSWTQLKLVWKRSWYAHSPVEMNIYLTLCICFILSVSSHSNSKTKVNKRTYRQRICTWRWVINFLLIFWHPLNHGLNTRWVTWVIFSCFCTLSTPNMGHMYMRGDLFYKN